MRPIVLVCLAVLVAQGGCIIGIPEPTPTSASPTTVTVTTPTTDTTAPSTTAPPPRSCVEQMPGPAPPSLPDLFAPSLVVFTDSRALRLDFSSTEGRYVVARNVSLAARGPVLLGDSIYARNGMYEATKVLRLDRNLVEQQNWTVEKLGAMHRHGDALLVAANRSLFALRPDLSRIGNVTTPYPGMEGNEWYYKMVDSIVVHDNVAYLVDDVWVPFYFYRVDVTNLGQMNILETKQLGGAATSYRKQWIDPDADVWVVLRNSGSPGYEEHALHLFQASTGADKGSIQLYQRSGAETGNPVAAILEEPSPWAVIRANERACLTRLRLEGSTVTFDHLVDLNVPLRGGEGYGTSTTQPIVLTDGLLYTGLQNTLIIIEADATPRTLLLQDLGMGIHDIAVLDG